MKGLSRCEGFVKVWRVLKDKWDIFVWFSNTVLLELIWRKLNNGVLRLWSSTYKNMKKEKLYAIANAMQDDCYARKSIFFHFATDFLAR